MLKRNDGWLRTGVVEVRVAKVAHADNASVQVVHGDAGAEEPLDLSAVEVDSHHTVHPWRTKQKSIVHDGEHTGRETQHTLAARHQPE